MFIFIRSNPLVLLRFDHPVAFETVEENRKDLTQRRKDAEAQRIF
jgi:hypothetical protein